MIISYTITITITGLPVTGDVYDIIIVGQYDEE